MKNLRTNIARRSLTALVLAIIPLKMSVAQGSSGTAIWPAAPVRIVVPFTPGTGIDILARTLGPKLSQAWGQPVVIENKPGASGNIGADQAAKARDGHTLLMGVNTLVINPALYPNLSYDVNRDFVPVGLAATGAFLLVANAKSGIDTAAKLVAQAKAKPGALSYASPGVATPHHMAMELFKQRAGFFALHIPFSGTAPAVQQVVGGEVPVMFLPVHVALPQIKGGRLVALAAAGNKRAPLAPDVPTLAELGYAAVEADLWFGMLAPAGTPSAIVQKINADMQRALDAADVKTTLASQGLEVFKSTGAEMATLMQRDTARWAALVKTQGIKAE